MDAPAGLVMGLQLIVEKKATVYVQRRRAARPSCGREARRRRARSPWIARPSSGHMALAPKTPERMLYLHGGRQPSECVLMAMQSMPNIARQTHTEA